jgi:hypothetical protein
MRRIPKSVNIGGLDYIVREYDDVHKVDGSADGSSWGKIFFSTQEIRLFKGLNEQKKWAVLLHEILHGIDENIKLNLNEGKTDELAVALLDLLVRNKLGLGA